MSSALVIVLSSCSAEGAGQTASQEQAVDPSARTSKATSEGLPPSTSSTAGGELTELQTYQAGLAEVHSQPDPPDVSVIRRVRPEEQTALVAACMTERGWAVKVDKDGGIVAAVPDDQVPALDESWYVCWASYPPLDEYLKELDEDQLNRLYSYYTDVLAPCLRNEGYAIDPPSRAQWLTVAITGRDYWVPYADISEAIPPDVAERCPLAPDDDVLYGSD